LKTRGKTPRMTGALSVTTVANYHVSDMCTGLSLRLKP
jgi:hypothetical protein